MSTLSNPYVTRHGMSASKYQTEFTKYTSSGYRLYRVSGYNVNGKATFAAIWVKMSGPAYVSHHNMTSASYQNKFDTYTNKGYRLTQIQGYEVGETVYYTAIWEKKRGVQWVAHHGMTSADYQKKFNTYVSQGYVLTQVEGYGVGRSVRYAAIWEKKSGNSWVARHGMDSAKYQAEFDKHAKNGYVLSHLSGYEVKGKDFYAAIWEKKSSGPWVAHHGMDSKQYQAQFMEKHLLGYRLQLVDGYSIGKSARYAAIWEAPKDSPNGKYSKGGYTFSLDKFSDNIKEAMKEEEYVKYGFELRHGLRVIQVAKGPARTQADPPKKDFTVFRRFNPASVAKTPTSVSTLQLLAKNNLSVDTKIHIYLPNNWNIPSAVKTISFAELMNHTSGFRKKEGQLYTYEGIKELVENGIKMENKSYDYDNTNYALLRILVASLDGYSNWTTSPGPGSAARFINYVNAHVFNPLGIYDVKYKATGSAPTLFYKYPPGDAKGTSYGDFTLKPGSAGSHVSIHELAKFCSAVFQGILIDSATLTTMKSQSLGFTGYPKAKDKSTLYAKGGYFPAAKNKGAELNSALVHSDTGVCAMMVINGDKKATDILKQAYEDAFVKNSTIKIRNKPRNKVERNTVDQ